MKDIFKNINREFVKPPKLEWPPIGITPRDVWLVRRISEINSAILRRKQSNEEVPKEWIYELKDIVDGLVANIDMDKETNVKEDM